MPLPSGFAERLGGIFAGAALSVDPAECLTYGYDNSRLQAMADAVVFPVEHAQVVALVLACRQAGVPLIARGRGTNTTGATVPVSGGVIASFERMQRIVRIDAENRCAVVEPGVLNADLQTALAPHGFFWAPDPSSAAFCTVGGNLACNAAGPRAVKYGTPRENTLGLRAVAGTGEEFRSGFYTSKGAMGYDLTRLLIGAEGTLALITEATLKLTPLPSAKRTMRATFSDIHNAASAVARVMAQPVTPCALEFLDDEALRLARQQAGDVIPTAGAMLLIEVDGEPESLSASCAAIERATRGAGLLEWCEAATTQEAAQLWVARKALSPALRKIAPMKINEDVVVPVSRLPALIDGLRGISDKYQIPIVNFGHAGNGNIHVNLLYRPEDPQQARNAPDCLSAVFDLVISLDGTLSGEHGIGMAKRDFLPRALDPASLELMRGIKSTFDPQCILNPDKLLPART